MPNNTNEFLKLFHNESKIHFRVLNSHEHKSINLYDTYENCKDQLQQYNDNNYDIYFTVNSGGTKQPEINKINAVFIDLDCGKDENKKYYSLEHVNEYKQECLTKINQFKFKPSAITETRNGLHIYWIVNNATIEQFLECQSLLISYFDSDPAVKTIERIMRVPDYNWCKNIHNKYKISIQLINNNTYNISDIIELLSSFKLNNSIMEKCAEDKEVYNNTYISSAQKPNLLIQSIINGDIETLQIILNTEPKILENESQFYDYITQEIKLNEFLGLPYHSFKCIFHNDNSPSAGIFITKNNQYFYKCHSGCCGFMGNIIRCVERLRECNRPQAINFIKQVYKLEVKESEWQQEQKNLLKANKQMLISGEFKESHPEIYKLIQKYIPLLQIMHDIAIDNVYDKKHSDDQNNVVFFTSINKICEGLGLSKGQRGRLSDKIGLLAFLLLIKKLNEKQIPEDYLQTATELKIKNKHKSIVNFYSIPSYSDAQMIKSLERAILYVENNLTMKGWSRELLQRTFGDEIANEIYPYFQHRKPTKESQVKTEHIHKVTNELINTYGYALEKDIIYNLIVECSENNEKYSKVQLEKQIKKSLQEMLDSYGWKRVRLNNKLKEAYGIECDGYPFAIIQG